MQVKVIILGSLLLCGSGWMDAQMGEQMNFAQSGKADPRESELYNDGTAAINDGKWDAAIEKFDQAAKLNGPKAPGALYWKAYAQYKVGRRSEASATIKGLYKKYPKSKWVDDARALVIEMKGKDRDRDFEAPEPPEPPDVPEVPDVPEPPGDRRGRSTRLDSDEELKLLALNNIMQNEPDRAVPIIEKLLQNPASSARLKEQALFVLSQSGSSKAMDLIARIANGSQNPELQKKAISMYGMAGRCGDLEKMYKTSNEQKVKLAIIDAYLLCGNVHGYLEVAKVETDPVIRKKAIDGLGMSGARQELMELYRSSSSSEVKRNIINAFLFSGCTECYEQVALTEQDAELRKKAIEGMGLTGGHRSETALLSIYEKFTDYETRKNVMNALFLSGNSRALITLYKKESDPKLKRALIDKLSIMGGPDVSQFMRDILDKE